MENATLKSDRMLQIYSRLVSGDVLNKRDLAQACHVTERSIQRDIDHLRCYFAEQGLRQEIIYDRTRQGYRLQYPDVPALSNSEIFAVCKILLESRSMMQDEMIPIIDKLVDCCVPEGSKKAVNSLLANEKFHYIEPHHGQHLLNRMWEIGQAVQKHLVMEIEYERLKEPRLVHRTVEPVGIMFSEYYFYLTAFLRDVDREKEFENKNDIYPTIYRLDRIRSYKVLNEHFHVPYRDRFEEGEFRKRVQFMFGGRLERIRFLYRGLSVEAVLDRLPSARIVEKTEEGYVITAETFGKGAELWLKGQGDDVVML